MDESGKLIGVIGDEVREFNLGTMAEILLLRVSSLQFLQDTVTGFVLAGVGQRNAEGSNFLIVKSGACAIGLIVSPQTLMGVVFGNRYGHFGC